MSSSLVLTVSNIKIRLSWPPPVSITVEMYNAASWIRWHKCNTHAVLWNSRLTKTIVTVRNSDIYSIGWPSSIYKDTVSHLAVSSTFSIMVRHLSSIFHGKHEKITFGYQTKNLKFRFKRHQIRSVTQLCPTLCDPMNRSTPGLPVPHQLPEFTQTHVHLVSDAIQSRGIEHVPTSALGVKIIWL